MNTDILSSLYKQYTGQEPQSIDALPGAGSNRRYYRLNGVQRLIGVCGTSVEENKAFVYMAQHFSEKGLPVPQVYAVADDCSAYLQEDLGNSLLFDCIVNGRKNGDFSTEEISMLKTVIRLLPRLQFEGDREMDYSVCHPQPEFNRRSILWDLNYFKYCFLKATGTDFQENLLEDDFERMADVLLTAHPVAFMYRDFQSRNVMIADGKPYFIDFQGGRRGPCYYDVASFLWQAKANYPQTLRQELAAEYLEALQPYTHINKEEFFSTLRQFVLFRTLQVLGAYGFRGYFEKKPHFLQSIPFAIENLRVLLAEGGFEAYPYLCEVLTRMTEQPQFAYEHNKSKLTVRVMSFSYKKGLPDDPSGNGGGYVFDCRAVHNPGRYEQYKKITGRDEPVIRFLEEDGEITEFLTHVDALVDAHVKRFLERGFTHLSVAFGCTGGQHRSVYSAEHVAHHLNEKFGIRIELIHREQNITEILPFHL